jgi:hypothetical protein
MYSKAQLIKMNSSPLGINWIRNIENIQDNAKIYPTGDASLTGRIYIALPADLELTEEIIRKYNIWV